jgi:hypothetical protein
MKSLGDGGKMTRPSGPVARAPQQICSMVDPGPFTELQLACIEAGPPLAATYLNPWM